VVDVQREDRDAERSRRVCGGVQERRRIAAAAVGDGDDARRPAMRFDVSAR